MQDSTRLMKEEFESKVSILDQEREQRMKVQNCNRFEWHLYSVMILLQAHYQFAEHRQKVEDTVDQITTADYKPISTHKLLTSLQDTTKLSAASK